MDTFAARGRAVDRGALRARYLANRDRSRELFALAIPEAYLDRPIPLRLPIVFYDGHIPAFSYNTLMRKALGAASINAHFERIFERGIDPDSVDAAKPRHAPDAWPDAATVRAYGETVDGAVLEAFAHADLEDERRSPLLERAQAVYNILEHEQMHHETLMYLMHRLPFERKAAGGRSSRAPDAAPFATGSVRVDAGPATVGARRDALQFGWDNEFDETAVMVPAFEIDLNSVTNGDWLAFVRAGGPVPSFWLERDGGYDLLAQFETLPLPLNWPVYVTHQQATAYATWRGGRLPTEAEYHRAAFGSPSGEERRFPWGDDAPSAAHGNFDFRRFDPEPVGISPAGASAWGVLDLIGNGWEWTSTVFAPLSGFAPMASYPQYSADFFDGAHYVMKGASPVTARDLVRRSFRNWFRPDYPYMYAKFRLVHP
jgi:iron(II)-dependent oxidoreductase